MAFHFPLMPRMYMALRKEDRSPIVEILRQTPPIPDECQWAIFLRNHDELTLEMVTDEERDYMYREYASDPRMRINIGIRRRLASLLDNGRRQIELMNALLLIDARHADHLLRRRDRHGRQHLSSATATACARRCSGTADGTRASPTRTSGALLSAHRRSALRLSGGERRRTGAHADVAASLDATDRRKCARSIARSAVGRSRCSSPRIARCWSTFALRGRDDPLRQQSLALRAVRRASTCSGSSEWCRWR